MIPFKLNSRKGKTILRESKSVVAFSWKLGTNYKEKKRAPQGTRNLLYIDCSNNYLNVYIC